MHVKCRSLDFDVTKGFIVFLCKYMKQLLLFLSVIAGHGYSIDITFTLPTPSFEKMSERIK